MRASELNCVGSAKIYAEKLEEEFPGSIKFTSGRRDIEDQARAMAQNVLKNRKWIVQTYVRTAESKQLQDWVDEHPDDDTQTELAASFLKIMKKWSDDQRHRISKHLSGRAWDVQPLPPGARANAVKDYIRKMSGVKFLEKEGGLIRWHAQWEH